MLVVGVVMRGQILGDGDEIVEHILLVGERTLFMPALAKFAASTQIGDDENSPAVEPQTNVGAEEFGVHADVIAAVAVQKNGIGARELRALAANDVERNRSAVLGCGELSQNFRIGE